MLANPLEIRVSPQAIPAQGKSPPVMPRIAKGMTRLRQPSPKSERPVTRTITASAMVAETERISTSTTGLMSWTATLMKKKDAPQISARPTSARYGSMPRRELDTRRPVVTREHERHGAVVLDGHPHVRSKTPRLGFYSALSESLDECEVQLFRAFGIARFQQARPPAAAHVREERELRHDQRRPPHVLEAQVHLSGLVREHAQVDHLVSEPAHGGVVVIGTRTHQQHEAMTNGCSLPRARFLPGHRPEGNALRDDPQAALDLGAEVWFRMHERVDVAEALVAVLQQLIGRLLEKRLQMPV